MKRITFLFAFLLAISWQGQGQILVSENFDSGTPTDWSGSYGNTVTASCAGNSERDNIYSFSDTGNLTSPNYVGGSNGTDLVISFDYKIVEYDFSNPTTPQGAGWGTAELQYSTDDGTNWVTILTIDDSNHTVSADCANVTATIDAADLPAGTDVKLQIANTWAAGDYYFYVDNFAANQQVNCVLPEATATVVEDCANGEFSIDVDVTDLGDSATLSLTNDAGVASTDVTATGVVTVGPFPAGTPVNLTLEHESDTDCNVDLGSFADACPAVNDACTGAIALTITTDDTQLTSFISANATEEPIELVDCDAFGNYGVWYSFVAPSSTLKFISGANDPGITIFEGPDCANLTELTTNCLNNFDGDITGLTTGNTYYAMVWDDSQESTPTDFALYYETCPAPTALDAINITDEAADLTWTAGNAETEWEVVWGPAGFDPATEGTTVSDNDGTLGVSLSGLDDETSYEFYVTAVCGANDESTQTGPFEFTTACSALTAPYDTGFESFTVSSSAFSNENCWTATSTAYLWEVADDTDTSSGGTGPAAGVSDGNYFFTEATSGNEGDVIDLVSPSIDLSTLNTPALYFDYHMFGGDMGTLEVVVDNGTSTSTIFTLTGQQQTTEDDPFISQTVALDAYAGETVQIIFRATRGSGFESDMAIDNVDVNEAPSCFPATDLAINTITGDSAELTFTGNNGGTSAHIWAVYAQGADAQSEAPLFNGQALAGETSASITGLDPTTAYDVYVLANCGASQSSLAGPVTFTTTAACAAPTELTISQVTASTAEISWTASNTEDSGYEWVVMADGEDPLDAANTPAASGTTAAGETMASVTGLSDNMAYDVYVRSVCSPEPDPSEYLGPESFVTDCVAFTPDYTESFDTFTPDCWEEAGSGDPTTGPSDLGSGLWSADGFLNNGTTGAARINLWTDNREDWLISPSFDLSAGGYELAYSVGLTDYNNSNAPEGAGMGSDDEVQVLITEDNGATWTALRTYNQSDYPSETGEIEIFDLSAYTGTVKFAFWATDGSVNDTEDYDFFIDEFKVRTPLTCSEVTGLSVSNITSNSAEINWDDNTDATAGYNWYVYESGADVTTATEIDSGSTAAGVATATTSLLEPLTNYDVYVEGNCDANGLSPLAGPVSIFTQGPGNCSSVGSYSYDNNESSADALGFIADTPGDYISLTFTAGSTESCCDDWFITDAADGTGNIIATGAGSIVGTYESPTGEISFYVVSDGSVTGTTFEYEVDCYPAPTCVAPTDVAVANVTTTTADFSWTDNVDATNGYIWYIFDEGADPDTATPVDTDVLAAGTESLPLTGLDPNMPYDFYIQSDCDTDGQSALEGPLNFTTLAVPPANDNVCDAIALTVGDEGVADEYTNVGATVETDEPAGGCYVGGAQKTVWFTFEAPTSGDVTISTDIGGTLTDTEIALYAAPTDCADASTFGAPIDCDQDGGDIVGNGWTSVISNDQLTDGETYYVQVSGYSNADGTFGIEVTDNATTSNTDFFSSANFSYYPNPVENNFTIESRTQVDEVVVYNMLGQEVKSLSPKSNTVDMNFNNVQAGVYLVKATIEGQTQTFRIIKK
ncbi:Por secretion system C-terminal sorting domain-containing protein [Psychroflexus salarius]|uniref:Por secretion system C-terminal sorting domain-containing protein n=1 Tax=Psychroflexus salarius TaxID=1155689 RepID=A0A1M4W5Y8_9FLAO|nr:fibronectin type III domain-containing protein [Psychroflexus salarius]SHE76617.1 Por secretion system C-terminal sorting domain-containing protein [Psychroflexus salarius]